VAKRGVKPLEAGWLVFVLEYYSYRASMFLAVIYNFLEQSFNGHFRKEEKI
jgi:hypothetical protein